MKPSTKCWLRSWIIPALGVLAICGVYSSVQSLIWIDRLDRQAVQRDARLAMTDDLNRRLVDNLQEQVRLRQQERTQLAIVSGELADFKRRHEAAQRRLERDNAEIRDLLSQPLPPGVQRELNRPDKRRRVRAAY